MYYMKMEITAPKFQNYAYLSIHRFSKEVLSHLTLLELILCISQYFLCDYFFLQ